MAIEAIFKIAIHKYSESLYADSLSLFVLLSTLIPENPDFWYRAGMMAQKEQNYELAVRLYQAAITIDSSLMAPWVFIIDCYLQLKLKSEAQKAYAQAIKMYTDNQADESWKKLLAATEILLNKI